jgi:signal transduction protein with GAF and PtsI domain
MDQNIETYIILIKHEMGAEGLKTIDKEFIKQIVLRAGGNPSEVVEVFSHPAVRKASNGEYAVTDGSEAA